MSFICRVRDQTMATMRRWSQQFGNRYCATTFQQLCWLAVLSTICVFVYYRLYLHLSYNHLENEYFTGADKCPACFGTGLCKRFRRGEFRFHSYSSVRLLDWFNVKNVYYATYLEQKPVVLKKLGHNAEHRQFDRDVCTNAEVTGIGSCDVAQQIYKSKLSDVMYTDMLREKDVMGLSDIVRCPSQRLLERIWHSFGEKQKDGSLARDNKLMLVTTLAFNPEPIILQAFPSRDGWPFPTYLGACGRFVVEEYSGHTLSYFYNFQFSTRAALAIQLLKIAERLSDNDDGFALYLTDVYEDNFAVTATGEVLVIDAENIIVVDKQKIKEEAKPGWDIKHQSEHTGCGSRRECLMFSHTDLCNHYNSDHNYYAICQGLFGKESSYGDGGLLHDLPPDLSPHMRGKLKELIAECRDPVAEGGRYYAAKELKTTLLKLI